MISDQQRAKIIQLRALGYSQREISEKTNLTLPQVNYNLQEINEQARQQGDDVIFIKTLADGFLPETLETIKKIHFLSGKM
ncbi:hypothetical protein GF319_03265 [Candidatus Bathyarchaeota archaeon]|nr:hypothetical protein [Candidatus Bathyarchaeota archaeon]